MAGTRRSEDPAAWDGAFDDAFVAAGPREPSAWERAAAAGAGVPARPRPGPGGPPVLRGSGGLRLVVGVAALVAALVGWSWHAAGAGVPLGRPAPAPAGEGGYAFAAVQADGSGRAVAFDPCEPVPYVVRPGGAPPGGGTALAVALAEVSRATGLVFADRGTTGEAPDLGSDRLGERGAGDPPPVLVAWSTRAETPELAGDVAGVAAPVQVAPGGPGTARWVTGQLVLDAEDLAHAPGDRAGEDAVRAVLLHELGHLVGLDHVPDPAQVMAADAGPVLALADGDLRGLHRLGLGQCF